MAVTSFHLFHKSGWTCCLATAATVCDMQTLMWPSLTFLILQSFEDNVKDENNSSFVLYVFMNNRNRTRGSLKKLGRPKKEMTTLHHTIGTAYELNIIRWNSIRVHKAVLFFDFLLWGFWHWGEVFYAWRGAPLILQIKSLWTGLWEFYSWC